MRGQKGGKLMGNSKIIQSTGQRIRYYRTHLGFSQERLAEEAGVHPTYIGQIERGEKNLTLESLEKISSALGISLSQIFEKAEDVKEKNNIPLAAYDLILAHPPKEQEMLYQLLLCAVRFKNG